MEEPESAPAAEEGALGGLTKLIVNLVPGAYSALLEAAKTTGDTQTDTVNRALQLYSFLVKQMDDGWEPALMRGGSIKTFKIE
jgi:hypothetical protein